MKAEDKYLLGILWKFGTIKSGTSQFIFQSYDKLDTLEYIRKRLAPDKQIKVLTRKAPRTGEIRTLYKLNFTNKEWSGIVRQYLGADSDLEKVIDKEFLRGFLELKGNYSGTNPFRFSLSNNEKEVKAIIHKLNLICGVDKINVRGNAKENPTCVTFTLETSEAKKIFKTFVNSNPVHWGKFIERIEKSPD